EEVVRHRQVVVGVGRAAELAGRLGRDPVLLHQLGHGVDAAALAPSDQLGVDAGAAVTGLDLGVDRPDFHEQSVAALLPGAGGTAAPGVVAGGGNPERFAEQAHGPPLPVLLDEAEGHSASLAKNAAAFFKMSRSAWRRLFSARRRRSSSSRAGGLPGPGKAWSPWAWRACFQERRRVTCTPRERAASATE